MTEAQKEAIIKRVRSQALAAGASIKVADANAVITADILTKIDENAVAMSFLAAT